MIEPDVLKAIEVHEKVIGENKLRGKEGLNLLESAIYAPFQTIGGTECFPDPIDKGVRLLVGIIKNHPFVDGNKRTAFVLFKELLKEHGFTLAGYTTMEMVNFLEGIAASEQDIENLINEAKNFLKTWLIRQK